MVSLTIPVALEVCEVPHGPVLGQGAVGKLFQSSFGVELMAVLPSNSKKPSFKTACAGITPSAVSSKAEAPTLASRRHHGVTNEIFITILLK